MCRLPVLPTVISSSSHVAVTTNEVTSLGSKVQTTRERAGGEGQRKDKSTLNFINWTLLSILHSKQKHTTKFAEQKDLFILKTSLDLLGILF